WQMSERRDCLLQIRDRFPMRTAFCPLHARLTKVPGGLLPHFALSRVVRKALDVLAQTSGVEMLDDLCNLRVEHSPAFVKQAAVGDVVCQGMLERVLDFGKKPGLPEEFGLLEPCETLMQFIVVQFSNGFEQTKRDVLADDRRRLQEALVLWRQPID